MLVISCLYLKVVIFRKPSAHLFLCSIHVMLGIIELYYLIICVCKLCFCAENCTLFLYVCFCLNLL